MKSTPIWVILGGALLLFGGSVDAWNRQLFNRYSRNLFQSGDLGAPTNNEIDEFNSLFGLGGEAGHGAAGGGGRSGGLGVGLGQQQPEVYGIVEPLIEDLPCVDRPCAVNEDCCPSGVCMLSYGEGKCVYDYGRKRDLCHRNADCEPGLACLKGPAGNFFCQPQVGLSRALGLGLGLGLKQFGEDCQTSSDCNVNKGMCCQLQRSHHRMLPKKMCAFFHDPFMCIDISPTAEDEDLRESRFLSSFSQRLM